MRAPRLAVALTSIAMALAASIPARADAAPAEAAAPAKPAARSTSTSTPTATPTATSDGALPDGRALMKRYVDAIGGAAAFSKVQGVVVSGRLQTEAGEVVGHMTTWRARPDRVKARTELVGYPPMEIGYDGVTGWSRAGSDPTKTLAGPELVQIKRQASEILSLADPDARFTKATTLARGTFEGKDSWKVALETNDGQKLTSWLAPDTGLQRGFETTFLTPNGEIPVTVVTLEYRLFGGAGGLKLPTVLMQHSGDRKTQMTIDEVSVNPPELPTFSPP